MKNKYLECIYINDEVAYWECILLPPSLFFGCGLKYACETLPKWFRGAS